VTVDGSDDNFVLREFAQPTDYEPAAVSSWVVAIVCLVNIDESVILRTEKVISALVLITHSMKNFSQKLDICFKL
jgi:hypothetical protein